VVVCYVQFGHEANFLIESSQLIVHNYSLNIKHLDLVNNYSNNKILFFTRKGLSNAQKSLSLHRFRKMAG
jgi:hypothetical protein